jgi:hypothetical protein
MAPIRQSGSVISEISGNAYSGSLSRLSIHRGIKHFLAIILLSAAGLKAYQVFTNSGPVTSGLVHDRLVILGVIESEMLLGLWLLVGGIAPIRRIVAIICFACFAGISAYEALHQLPDCGCFGKMKIPPMFTAAFDVGAVFALLVIKPGSYERQINDKAQRRIVTGISFALLFSCGLWGTYLWQRAHPPINRSAALENGDLVILDPGSWLNKPFPLIDDIDGGNRLSKGRWLVV